MQNLALNYALRPVVQDLYNSAKGSVKQKLEKIKADRAVAYLSDNISYLEKVRTINNLERDLTLEEFYVSPTILFGAEENVLDSFETIKHKSPILVEGIAGQGKSILLRYICVHELKIGERIPFFIELRKKEKGQCFREFLYSRISSYGLDVDKEVFEYLIGSGRLLLLLDGFDEIHPEDRQSLVVAIEDIVKRNPNLLLVVSSRPNSGIQSSTLLNKVAIKKQDPESRREMIRVLAKSTQYAEKIISALDKNPSIEESLSTPLLVTLLTITYLSEQYIPPTLHEFYDQVFSALTRRHDSTKPGYERPRKSHLGDYAFQKVFEALSFFALKENKTRFSAMEFHGFAERALQAEGHDAALADSIMDDIEKITCLIIEDGLNEYEYLHKSLQEFFAAQYIKRQSDKNKEKFYAAVISSIKLSHIWKNAIEFLCEVDSFQYRKNFLFPQIKRFLSVSQDESINVKFTKELIHMIIIED